MNIKVKFKNKTIIEVLPDESYVLVLGFLRRNNIPFTIEKEIIKNE